jgi:hypothetical protein
MVGLFGYLVWVLLMTVALLVRGLRTRGEQAPVGQPA